MIGVVGRNPFGDELENIVRDRRVNGRSLRVVLLASAAGADLVHVLFFAGGEEKHFDAAAPQLAGVLTVGESRPFATAGGIVVFSTAADKVRFEINAVAAECTGLKISAQLQKLAVVVRRNP